MARLVFCKGGPKDGHELTVLHGRSIRFVSHDGDAEYVIRDRPQPKIKDAWPEYYVADYVVPTKAPTRAHPQG